MFFFFWGITDVLTFCCTNRGDYFALMKTQSCSQHVGTCVITVVCVANSHSRAPQPEVLIKNHKQALVLIQSMSSRRPSGKVVRTDERKIVYICVKRTALHHHLVYMYMSGTFTDRSLPRTGVYMYRKLSLYVVHVVMNCWALLWW